MVCNGPTTEPDDMTDSDTNMTDQGIDPNSLAAFIDIKRVEISPGLGSSYTVVVNENPERASYRIIVDLKRDIESITLTDVDGTGFADTALVFELIDDDDLDQDAADNPIKINTEFAVYRRQVGDPSDMETAVTIESVEIEFTDADGSKMTKNFTIDVGVRVALTAIKDLMSYQYFKITFLV